jgi:AraC-like DNA-binding protein
VELSTSTVPAREAFAFWRDMICATFVQLDARPVAGAEFAGRIEHVPVGELELSTVVAGSQHVRRTRSLVARGDEEYLLASIQVGGQGRVEQDDRSAVLAAGEMAFYDSTRPYTLHFDDPFHQLVVQIPKRELSLGDTRNMTARLLGRQGPGGVVATFFTSLHQALKTSPTDSATLLPQAVGLLSAAASVADRARPDVDAVNALVRERVLEFLRRNLTDPGLDAARIAQGCGVSRRTLYRVLAPEGVAARLRRMRIECAKELLVTAPERPVGRVGLECGFDSESGFYRAFRAATGHTPGEYREMCTLGTPGQ